LVLLQGLDLPKWGPGYLQLAGIEEQLKAAAAAAARDIVLFEGGRPLAPIRSETQISLPSDRSFDGYATALSHVQGPRLPVDTKVFWNQGYFDAHIEYPVRSGTDFALHLKISPGLGQRIKLRVQFLPMSGPSLTYELSGGAGRISLDPRWYEVAWIFARRGFSDVFVVDRLVFLVCLVTPFRQFWSLLMVVLALTGMQAVTSIADAVGAAPEVRWLPMLFDSCLGAAVVLLAVENVVAPNLRRRWFVAAVVGALGGFGLGHLWAEQRQVAGARGAAPPVRSRARSQTRRDHRLGHARAHGLALDARRGARSPACDQRGGVDRSDRGRRVVARDGTSRRGGRVVPAGAVRHAG
jgi:hypothetical protein